MNINNERPDIIEFIPDAGELIRTEEGLYKVGDGRTTFPNLPFVRLEEIGVDKKYGLGCLKSPYDARDYMFSSVAYGLQKERFPREYISMEHLLPFNQGSTSMCCACATAMSRLIWERNENPTIDLFSPGYIYGNRCKSVVVDGVYDGEGMYLKDALKQLNSAGVCFYDRLPTFGNYKQVNSAYLTVKDEADKEAFPYRTTSYYAVKTEREIKKAIMTTGSVLISFLVTSGWYDAQDDGIIPTYGTIEGGHAVLLVGWKIINDKQYWVILNSWGKDWGDEGYGYIETTEMAMEAYCILDEIQCNTLKEESASNYRW